MNIERTNINGLNIITTERFIDERGYFERVFCMEEYGLHNLETKFVQVNHSCNVNKGTWRGLHFQRSPYSEVKMIRCIQGVVLDVIVDLRKESSSFLSSVIVELSAIENKAVLIPKGCAHGFLTLEDNCHLIYFHSEYYNPKYEGALNILDPALGIKLPHEIAIISEKDKRISFLDTNFGGI
jgi:dTDP-4-dehydrorhamnose 3,5-epimerase